jgi:hypothetical protein
LSYDHVAQQITEAVRRWRPAIVGFRYRGSRHESAVAQLSTTSGSFEPFPYLMKHRKFAALLVVVAVLAGGCSKRSEAVAIEPGVAIGSVRSGMTIQQVIEKLGPPDQTNDSVLMYAQLGIQIAPGSRGQVYRVTIAHPFAGHSKEGIGIGSSRPEVIRAYGDPTVAKPGTSGCEFLRYSGRGLVVQLHDGKADMMSVFFPTAK